MRPRVTPSPEHFPDIQTDDEYRLQYLADLVHLAQVVMAQFQELTFELQSLIDEIAAEKRDEN